VWSPERKWRMKGEERETVRKNVRSEEVNTERRGKH
jgi:hypothetical protein